MGYTQLTEVKRYQIYTLVGNGFTQSDAANQVGVHPSTVSQELSRNTGERGYRPQQANKKAILRRKAAFKSCLDRKFTG